MQRSERESRGVVRLGERGTSWGLREEVREARKTVKEKEAHGEGREKSIQGEEKIKRGLSVYTLIKVLGVLLFLFFFFFFFLLLLLFFFHFTYTYKNFIYHYIT